jgi:hypothetical protein
MKVLLDFDLWIDYMLNCSDYSESELIDFEEHYQNMLDLEENMFNFIKFISDESL